MANATSKRGSRTRDALLAVFEAAMRGAKGTFEQRESEALGLANDMLRQWTQGQLAELSSVFGDEVTVKGKLYRKHATGTVRYHSLCGPLEVRRDSYRLVGVHNGPTVIPLELAAGILENATPALAASVLQAYSTMPLRHYQDEMREAHRIVPSRSTLERIAKRLGARIRDEQDVHEPAIRELEQIHPDARSISVGLDRTSVPMAEPAERSQKKRKKPYVRRAPSPVTVAFRMAYVATLAVHDRRGETLTSIRIAATAEEGSEVLMDRLGQELLHLRAQRPKLPLVVVQDGAPELWILIEDWLRMFSQQAALKLIDRYHVDERLAQVCQAIDRKDAPRQLRKCRKLLDKTDLAMRRICRRLDKLIHGSGDERLPWPENPPTITGERARVIDGHLGYFEHNQARFRYATARRRGFPIGSGVTEGACKSVIAARFKRSGQRWREHGVSPCLHLRCLNLNNRLRPTLQRYAADVRNTLAFG